MTVLYNSQTIIPGPLFDIRKEIVRTAAGDILRRYYSIQAKGTIMAWKGSPNSTGAFYTGSYSPGPADESIPDVSRLASLRSKMGALVNLFAQQGMWLEIQPFDGSQSIKFQPRIKGINFANGLWYDRADYTIDMEADTIWFGGQEVSGSITGVVPEETWSIESADQIGRTYRLTHTVSSQQTNLYDNNGNIPTGNHGWERAQTIVTPYLGVINQATLTPTMGIGGWQGYNYFRSQQIDEPAGRYAVTETWLMYDATQGTGQQLPPALDDFTINSRLTEEGLIQVTLEGTITGLETRDYPSDTLLQSRWTAATLYFNTVIYPSLYTRASTYSGILLNPVQLTSSIGRNPVQGTISYSAEYSNRVLPLIPQAIREEISIQTSGGTDVFASIPVVGRPWGPVLQAIDTITERTLSISINAQIMAANMLFPALLPPNTDGIVLSFAPIALQVFRNKDEVSWSSETGKYGRNVSFTYQ